MFLTVSNDLQIVGKPKFKKEMLPNVFVCSANDKNEFRNVFYGK